jgi:hypothetical protein
LRGFFLETVSGMPCCFGFTEEEMRAGFFDIVSVLGSHFHFTFEDYKNMTTRDILELYHRYKKHCKEVERQSKRGRR